MSIKTKWLIAPLAAAAIALSACGGDSGEETTPEDTATAETTEETAPVDDASEPEGGETAPEGGETAPEGDETAGEGTEGEETEGGEEGGGAAQASEQAAAAVDDFMSRYEGSERMDPSLFETGDTGQTTEGAEIEPAECAAAIEGIDTSIYENAAFDGATQVDTETFATKTLVIAEMEGGGAANALDQSRQQAETCSSYTMSMGGQTIEGSLAISEIDIAGADQALVQETTIGTEGAEQTTYTVVAIVGDAYITGMSVSADPAAGPEEGQQIVTDALAAMG